MFTGSALYRSYLRLCSMTRRLSVFAKIFEPYLRLISIAFVEFTACQRILLHHHGSVGCWAKSSSEPRFKPFPHEPLFLRVRSKSLLKTLWEKEKLLVTSKFSSSHRVFYPFREPTAILVTSEIVVCKLFEFRKV